ncbi:hypothetical protein M5C72_03655 [Companilactobacillus allii]|uniref:Antibiotic biosynthesis monooxygenase n=1 Tax=Companilactobacillus allii TaxID=1847728 RepID=A0A1P8Q338_9LACO|nr:hypothetical protein [Companilactobacillus allii]APX72248.1 hypothetical protein BTM29_06595 [Companilactobacillus allii]USQ69341.1 hypothetical protein M5C72_03655 [Companilactobacillus allii]
MEKLTQAPLFRLFNLKIDPINRTSFLDVGQNNLMTSIKNEVGTLAMYTGHLDSSGADNIVIELYKDQPSYEIHANSPQFAAFKKVAGKIVVDQSVTSLNPQLLLESTEPVQGIKQAEFVQLTELTIDDSSIDKFRILVSEKMKQDKSKSEVLVAYAGNDSADSTKWYLFEIYQNKSVYDDCQKEEYVKKYKEETKQMIKQTKNYTLNPDTVVNHGGLDFENK